MVPRRFSAFVPPWHLLVYTGINIPSFTGFPAFILKQSRYPILLTSTHKYRSLIRTFLQLLISKYVLLLPNLEAGIRVTRDTAFNTCPPSINRQTPSNAATRSRGLSAPRVCWTQCIGPYKRALCFIDSSAPVQCQSSHTSSSPIQLMNEKRYKEFNSY